MAHLWVVALLVVVLIAVALLVPRLHRSEGTPARGSSRIALTVPVRLWMNGGDFELTSSDISRGGICLLGDLRTSAGQPVKLQFALPGSAPLAVHGVVRWAQRGRVGVLFDLQDRRRIAIGDWIAAQPAPGEARGV